MVTNISFSGSRVPRNTGYSPIPKMGSAERKYDQFGFRRSATACGVVANDMVYNAKIGVWKTKCSAPYEQKPDRLVLMKRLGTLHARCCALGGSGWCPVHGVRWDDAPWPVPGPQEEWHSPAKWRRKARARIDLVCTEDDPGPKGKLKAVMKAVAVKLGKRKSPNQKKKKMKMRRKIGSATSANQFSTSLVSDGVNVGSVWKNSSAESVTFPVCREKITDITTTSTAYVLLQSLYLNPGNSVLFPIFSQIAANYEQYVPRILRFYWRTEAYMASGSVVSAGLVGMATNFDPDDSAFSSMTQLENYAHSETGAPFTGVFCHDVLEHARRRSKVSRNPELALKSYFVYSSGNASAPSNSTSKFYDIGLFQLACNNTQSGVLGELWVEYSFTMVNRKQQTPLGQNLLAAHIVESPAASAAAAGSDFLGTSGGVLRAGSTLPTVVGKATFTLPVQGVFLVAASWNVAVTIQPTITYGSNITALTYLADNSANENAAVQSGLTVYLAMVSVAAAGTGATNTATITGLTNLAAGTADIVIAQIPGGLLQPPRPASDEYRFAVLESQVQRLMGLLSPPPRSASCVTVEEEQEAKSAIGQALSRDELGSSVHIPRGLLAQLMGTK